MKSQSGYQTYSSLIQGFTNIASVRWSARYVWINLSDGSKPTRILRSRLVKSPESLSAFVFADLIKTTQK